MLPQNKQVTQLVTGESVVSTYDVAQTAAAAVAARAAVVEAAESVRDDGGGGY